MLDRVTFPLTTAQISEFVLDKEYTNFLTLQTAISELMETGLAESRTILNRTQLQITDEGRDTLHYFENRISDAIKSDIIDLKIISWSCATNPLSRGIFTSW